MYRSILVPLDGSLRSEQSLPYAAAVVRRSGAALQLAYVHTPLVLGEGVMYLGTADVQLWEEEKNYLLSVADRLKKAGGTRFRPMCWRDRSPRPCRRRRWARGAT